MLDKEVSQSLSQTQKYSVSEQFRFPADTHKATASLVVLPLLRIIHTFTITTYYYLLLRQSEAHHAVATIAAIATVATIVTVAAEVTVAATEIAIATAFMSNVKSQSFRSENQKVQAG